MGKNIKSACGVHTLEMALTLGLPLFSFPPPFNYGSCLHIGNVVKCGS
jgi:hypothetical protein